MNTYLFTGKGKYSITHNWDNGIKTELGNKLSFKDAKKEEAELALHYSLVNSRALPKQLESGIFINFTNEYSGIRIVYGYVIAKDSAEAEQILEDYEDSFQIIEQDKISVADEAMEYN